MGTSSSMHKDLPSNKITMTAATAQPVQWTTSQSQFNSRHGTFFFPPRRLDRLCRPPSLLFNGYPTPRLRMRGANLPCTPSCLELLIRHSYTAVCLRCAPYVAVKRLADTAVSRIRTGRWLNCFRCFPLSPRANDWAASQTRADLFIPHPYQVIIH